MRKRAIWAGVAGVFLGIVAFVLASCLMALFMWLDLPHYTRVALGPSRPLLAERLSLLVVQLPGLIALSGVCFLVGLALRTGDCCVGMLACATYFVINTVSQAAWLAQSSHLDLQKEVSVLAFYGKMVLTNLLPVVFGLLLLALGRCLRLRHEERHT